MNLHSLKVVINRRRKRLLLKVKLKEMLKLREKMLLKENLLRRPLLRVNLLKKRPLPR